MTFGLDFSANVTQPTRNFSKVGVKNFLAPLWFPSISADLLTTNVSWQSQSAQPGEDPGYILEFASDAVLDYSYDYFGAPTEFNPKWAMIVNWNVTLLPRPDGREDICSDYYTCDCEGGSGSEDFTAAEECDPALCYFNLGRSVTDVAYLKLLCDSHFGDDYDYFYEFGQQSIEVSLSLSPPLHVSWPPPCSPGPVPASTGYRWC